MCSYYSLTPYAFVHIWRIVTVVFFVPCINTITYLLTFGINFLLSALLHSCKLTTKDMSTQSNANRCLAGINCCNKRQEPFIAAICNASLRKSCLAASQKTAIITPTVKKSGLEPKDQKSYRLISNTSPYCTVYTLHIYFHRQQLQNVFSVFVIYSCRTVTGWSRRYSIVGNALRSPGGLGGSTCHHLAGGWWHKLHRQSSCWCISFRRTWLYVFNRSTALFDAILAANTTITVLR